MTARWHFRPGNQRRGGSGRERHQRPPLSPAAGRYRRLLYTIASSPDLGQVTETATLMATGLLTAHGGLDTNQAIALQSIAGDLQICQVVDPNKTCCFAMPRTVTEQLRMERMELP